MMKQVLKEIRELRMELMEHQGWLAPCQMGSHDEGKCADCALVNRCPEDPRLMPGWD